MYHILRNDYEIRTGKRSKVKTPIQFNESKQLMTNEEIIQKIKKSQSGQLAVVESKKKKPWINYEYFHPGQWVKHFIFNLFISNS
jgi:hypothetical protein